MKRLSLILFVLIISCAVPPKYILQYPGWVKKNKERYIELEHRISSNPKDIKALLEQGAILDNMAFYDSAIAKYEKIIAIDSNFAPVYGNLGNTYVSTKRNDEALYNFNKAILIDSTYALAYLNLGGLYGSLGNKEKQLWCYKNAVKFDQNNPLHYYNLACFYSTENNISLAMENLDLSLQKGFKWIDHMKRDESLENLKKSNGYNSLLKKYGIN